MANIELTAEQGMVIQGEKPKRRLWLWACGGGTLIICVVLGIIAFILYSLSNESYPLHGEVSFPSTVKKGDDFDLVITLTNPTADPVFINHFTLQSFLAW